MEEEEDNKVGAVGRIPAVNGLEVINMWVNLANLELFPRDRRIL